MMDGGDSLVMKLATYFPMLLSFVLSMAVLFYVLRLLRRLVTSVEKLADVAERHAQRQTVSGEPPQPQ